MIWRATAAVTAAFLLIAAQSNTGFDGESFVEAVKKGDADKAQQLLRDRGPTIVNARNGDGDTALIVAVARRDDGWTGLLLNNGADPNLANRAGDTALIAAARVGYEIAAEWLLGSKAKVDQANRMGETALIVAVQQRHRNLVKLLLARGADPDKADSAAGYSARDYAKRDSRNPELLRLIEAKKKPAATAAK